MVLIFCLLCIVMVFASKIIFKGINTSYLSKEQSQALKGVFIIIVFLSHIRGYAAFDSYGDSFVKQILSYLGQLMVAYFLFVSGYGVFESIKRKGKPYIQAMPKNRIGKTFFEFSLAIFAFLVMNFLLKRSYSGQTIALAFTGWTSIGNSNWYMFAIFTLYIISYLSFSLFTDSNRLAILSVTVLSLLYIYIMVDLKDNWWSDTYLCYVCGMWFSYFKDKIDDLIYKIKSSGWIIITLFFLACYLYVSEFRHIRVIFDNVLAVLFCLLIVIFSMKICFKSYLLEWCGKNLFWLYILQRIPMIIFQHYGLDKAIHSSVFALLCLFVTILLAIGMDKFTSYLLKNTCWNQIINKK